MMGGSWCFAAGGWDWIVLFGWSVGDSEVFGPRNELLCGVGRGNSDIVHNSDCLPTPGVIGKSRSERSVNVERNEKIVVVRSTP